MTTWRSWVPPRLADVIDLLAQRVEFLVAPLLLFQQRGGGLHRRTAEEHAHQLTDGFSLRARARRHRRVDIAKALAAMLDRALRFELGQHRPHRRVAGRVAEFFADLLGAGGIAERVEDVEDFPFTAAEFGVHVTCYEC